MAEFNFKRYKELKEGKTPKYYIPLVFTPRSGKWDYKTHSGAIITAMVPLLERACGKKNVTFSYDCEFWRGGRFIVEIVAFKKGERDEWKDRVLEIAYSICMYMEEF